MNITIFPNGYDLLDAHYITVDQALNRIRIGKSKEKVEEIRNLITEGKDAAKKKLTLPSVLFHGEFTKEIEKVYQSGAKKGEKYGSKREDDSITKYSGYLILDFDKCDPAKKKSELMNDSFIYAAWVSPSGNGVKALIKVPPKQEHHYQYYSAILEKYKDADPTSRSISRLCFESYDENIYINKNSHIWDKRKIEIDKSKERLCTEMILNAPSGQGHLSCLKAGYLAGGLVSAGLLQEQSVLQSLFAAARIRRPNEIKDSESAIESAFKRGMVHPLSDHSDIEKLDEVVRSVFKYRKAVDAKSLVVSRESITETSAMFNKGLLPKPRVLGIPELDEYLVFRNNSFYTITGRKGLGKTTTMWYLFALDAYNSGAKTLMVLYENDAFEAEQEIIGFLVGNDAKWVYHNQRSKYDKASDFFHEHFTVLNIPIGFDFFQIFDVAAQLNSDNKYDKIFIDPAYKVAGMDDYGKVLDMAGRFLPFSREVMSLWISNHPTSMVQRAKGQPRDVDAQHGALFSMAADYTIIIDRDNKNVDETTRNTINLTIDKVRSKKIKGGEETYSDCPIKLEYQWKKHQYKIYVPSRSDGNNYTLIENPFEIIKNNKTKPAIIESWYEPKKEESFFDNPLQDAPF